MSSLNLPNLLSLARILLAPLALVVLLTVSRFAGKELVALAVFLAAAFTDFLDGFLARRRGQVTRLGKLLDPAADKILTAAAFVSLVGLGRVAAWIVVVILAREFAVSTLRSLAAAERLVLGAMVSGKVKTVLQVIAIATLILALSVPDLQAAATVLLWLALLATLYSGAEYFVRFRSVMRER